MNKSIIEAIYKTVRMGNMEDCPIIDTFDIKEEVEEANKKYDDFVKALNLDLDRNNELYDLISTERVISERSGFLMGFELGSRLALEMLGMTERRN